MRTEREEIINEYGWLPKKLKGRIVSTARQLLIYDDNGKPTLDDDFRRGFEEPAEIWVYFLDAEQRLPEDLLEYFFDVVEERAGGEEEYSFKQRVSDLLDFHADRMSDALQEYVGPELQTTYPDFNWYVGVGGFDGLFGIYVTGKER